MPAHGHHFCTQPLDTSIDSGNPLRFLPLQFHDLRWDVHHFACRIERCDESPLWTNPGLGAQGVIIKDVRYYTTKTMNGGTTFKCTMCEHSVTTLDFDHVNGNLRMQAAAVINKHAAFLHLPTWVRTKLGSRGAL